MAEAAPVEAPSVSARVAGEVVRGVMTGEAGVIFKKKGELSPAAVDVVAGEKVPPDLRDSLFLQLFGETSMTKVDPKLKPLATQLDTLMSRLTTIVEPNYSGSVTEINKAIEQVVLQTDGWAEAFKGMNAAQRSQFLKQIREGGMMPAARKTFVERAIGAEGGAYSGAKTAYDEAHRAVTSREKELSTIGTALGTKDRSKITAERDASKREVDDLKGEKKNLQLRKTGLEDKMSARTSEYIKKGKTGADLTTALDADPEYQKWKTDLSKIDSDLTDASATGLDGRIKTAEDKLRQAEETLDQFKRQEDLTKQIDDLKKQEREAEATMSTARSELVKKLNELMRQLDGVLPEAAKESLNRLKDRIDQANIEVAKDKAKEAAKEGDIMNGAKANIVLFYNESRYVRTEQQRSSSLRDLFRVRGVKTIDKTGLRADFDGLFTADGRGSANLIQTRLAAALAKDASGNYVGGLGLSPEQLKYLDAHPETQAKLIESAKIEVFKTVSRQAVLHLNLTSTDMDTLVSSNDFIQAGEAAMADKAKAEQVKQALGAAGLKNGTFREIAKNVAKPALMGLLIMLVLLGVLSATKVI